MIGFDRVPQAGRGAGRVLSVEETVPAGAGLRQVLLALGEPVIDLVAAPAGLDVEITDVAILDADEEPEAYHADLVLLIGARGRRAARLAWAAGRRGAAAVALKVEAGDDRQALKELAEGTGTVVLGVRPEVRWSRLDAQVREVLADARWAGPASASEQPADLFALAETVAALTGGIVSIEDSANRVLAYSRSDDDVDELRRRSILGREGPAHFLALLRQWGVYERLRAGEEVVHVEERPERGIRRRLAIGIRVDEQTLGSIWVQQGREELSDNAESALIGAARTAALLLVRNRTGAPTDLRLEDALLSRMLEGHIDPRTFAARIGADLGKPAAVVGFALRDTTTGGEAGRPAFELRRADLTNLVSVHAAAFRRRSLVAGAGTRVYMLLPGLQERSGAGAVAALAQDIVRTAGQRLQLDVYAAVGSVVEGLDIIAESKAEADRVLDIIAAGGERRVATIDDVRSEVLVGDTLALLERHPRLRDPRISALLTYDQEHETGLVTSVLAYLAAQSNMRAAARLLHVHTNTLRYRLKRAEAVSGIDLNDPHQCLFSHLQLLLETGAMPVPHT
ncbi:helix-turn-helix domain-containing protein [Streptomyces actuosus]|uniref:Helix-turn-helix domain-containing protein n=1 Tax=Streptomyces actuosus TaxID=1885 RepID=A0ABS2VM97_STRAS|nr:helix-turn-helix domain-containing protein [Streptomyces actuosus]MBN0044195.1 helix-turn-helix domain-containing protein [Streptomyces actuosus]